MRAKAAYKIVRDGLGNRLKKCGNGNCGKVNLLDHHVCRSCGWRMARPKKVPRPKRGTAERTAQELAKVAKFADLYAGKVKRAVALLAYYHRRERQLTALLASGPRQPRPKRPKAPRRGITLGG